MPQFQIIFMTNSFYLGVTAATDKEWLQTLIDVGAIVKTDIRIMSDRNEPHPYTAVYWIDEVRAKGHLDLPQRPQTSEQFSINTKPSLN